MMVVINVHIYIIRIGTQMTIRQNSLEWWTTVFLVWPNDSMYILRNIFNIQSGRLKVYRCLQITLTEPQMKHRWTPQTLFKISKSMQSRAERGTAFSMHVVVTVIGSTDSFTKSFMLILGIYLINSPEFF